MHPKRSDTSSSVGHQTPDTSLLVLQPLAAETLHHFHLVERCNGVSPQNQQGLWDFMHMRMPAWTACKPFRRCPERYGGLILALRHGMEVGLASREGEIAQGGVRTTQTRV